MKKETIKEWYCKKYPTDDLGSQINSVTFLDLYDALKFGKSVYNVIMNSILNELEQEKSELVKQLKLFLDKTTVGDKVRSFVDEAEYRGRIKTINDAISIVKKYYS